MHKPALLLAILLLLASTAFGQQTHVTRYDLYGGYAFLDSPAIGLLSHGFQTQIGMRAKRWVSLGFDYSATWGSMTIKPELLPDATQQALGAQLKLLAQAGKLPAGYTLQVPADAFSQTFAAGPQLAYRHFKKVTLFVRPSMGAIRECATPKPGDAIAAAIVSQLSPHGKKYDWQGFYGIGYGFDLILNDHLAIRTQGDLVWDHLFNDILKNGRWTTRFSVGPAFNFGRNIVE